MQLRSRRPRQLGRATDHAEFGIEGALLAAAARHVASRRALHLQVKTVADASASHGFAGTRKFYPAQGFSPLEVFPTCWDPWNPAPQLVKSDHAT